MSPSVIALIVAVVALAGTSAFLFARFSDARSRADERGAEVTRLTGQLTTAGTAHTEREHALFQQVRTAEIDLATLKATLEKEQEATAAKLVVLQEAETRLRDAFAVASRDALTANSSTFLELAKTALGEFQQVARSDFESRQKSVDEIVKPVQEGLVKVTDALQAFDKQRAESHSTLQEQLRSLAITHGDLATNTQNLVQALRAPQGRGRWGEMQLRRVVELAGMVEHCDFREQQTIEGGEGRLRPDLLVHLPGRKVVVVDSKAPLNAYLEAVNATNDTDRAALLDKHARQVKDHIAKLAAKDYASELSEAPDFVIMFLPGEDFFSAAWQRDATLIEYAIGEGVVPASPTTLITLLKAVAYGWQQERIQEKAEEIRDLGQELYRRMTVFADHLANIRKGLQGAVDSYNRAVASIEGRVLPAARRLRDVTGAGDDEIERLGPVDSHPRLPVAPELLAASSDTASREIPATPDRSDVSGGPQLSA